MAPWFCHPPAFALYVQKLKAAGDSRTKECYNFVSEKIRQIWRLGLGFLADAVALLIKGGILVYPTDTVYGLGADATNSASVSRVFEVKGRQAGLSLPVIACDLAQARECAVFTPGANTLAAAFWPGALTLVLERRPAFPGYACKGGLKIAVRVPDQWLAVSLARGLGHPITGTSANLSGQPSARDPAEARRQLDGRVDLFVDAGRCAGGLESAIIDASGQEPVILREGAIPGEAIRQVWQEAR
jgi:L-threonylcarbamoyladenylate synthase